MTLVLRPDICVIGAGSGGLSVAAAAASFGVDVVLVEKGEMGGDCLNYGCVPSKALLAAAKHAEAMRHGSAFGIDSVDPVIDFKLVNRHVRSIIAEVAPNDSAGRFAALGVHVIRAPARFIDPDTVAADDVEIKARRFVIATGSSPRVPPIDGLADVDHFTNETIFTLARRPGHLVIVGGGPIGIELAQAFRRLGSRVTVLEGARALGAEDPEIAAIALRALREEGVDLREETAVTRVERRGKTGIRVHVARGDAATEIDGTHLLVATGRVPNLDGLDLHKARIRHGSKGVHVSDRLRTSNRRVYAIGDVAGGPQFTHVAGYHAGLVIRSILFRLPARADTRLIPSAVYTDPEIARIGMSEQEAVAARLRPRILRWPYAENDRAQAERRTPGHIKLLVGRRERILGVTIVGAGASEMIGIWALAMARDLRLRDVASLVLPYPTMGEIGKRASIAYFAPVARRPLVRALVRFLRLFG